MFYSLLWWRALFSLIWSLFFFQGTFRRAVHANHFSVLHHLLVLVFGGWLDVPQGAGGPLWASGLPARHSDQTELPDSLLRLLSDPSHTPQPTQGTEKALKRGFSVCLLILPNLTNNSTNFIYTKTFKVFHPCPQQSFLF